MNQDLSHTLSSVKAASRVLATAPDALIVDALHSLSKAIVRRQDEILDANQADLSTIPVTDFRYDRIKLTPGRIAGIAAGIDAVASLPAPTGRILSETTRPNGLEIKKISVPFGVVGIIYEARPNVTLDVFSLCLRSGNACVLKGGRDADRTSRAEMALIKEVLSASGLSPMTAELLPATHEAAAQMLKARGLVDVIVPRGGKSLIDFVREHATVPVIETGAGVCHTYFSSQGDLRKGQRIVLNAKTRRVSVCNAMDCLLMDERALALLPDLCAPLEEKGVSLFCDEQSYFALTGRYNPSLLSRSREDDYGKEFLSLGMNVKMVRGLDEALSHIMAFGSGHSECIVTEDKAEAGRFCSMVDAACVYVNAPTSFSDGGEFGLGAEVGISTQKLHARGPMGIESLTTSKWIVEGDGQMRP